MGGPTIGDGPASGATLLRRFTLASLVATAIVGALLGTIAAHGVEEYAYRQRAHTMAFDVSEFLAPRLTSQDFARAADGRSAELESAFRGLIGRAGIRGVIVWKSTGEMLYSTPPRRPDHTRAASRYVSAAIGGRIAWRRAEKDSTSVIADDLEVFIPIFISESSHPVGAYAVIARMPDLVRSVLQLRKSVWLSVLFGLLVLYTVQFSIVHQAARDLERQRGALHASLIGTVKSLASAVDARDLATGNHSSRVGEYAEAIARAMGLRSPELQDVQTAGYLHDVGKIGVPDAILTKRGQLSEEERATIQYHSVCGYEILEAVPIPERIKLAVRHNHECWDGTGYPDGLAGEAIPLLARIVAVADAYEALTTARPYRAACPPEKAIEEIRRCSGAQFDPRVVEALLHVGREWAAIRCQNAAAPEPVETQGTMSEALGT